jgi:hypothetical protein
LGKFSTTILPHHRAFIEKQRMFFTASAPLSEAGHINISPKGIDSFRVLSETQVGYMDLIGSGNETSAHLLENGRITFLFCAFDGPPNILRLYGKGRTVLPGTAAWEEFAPQFTIYPSTRQIIIAEIGLVQTSCGYGVPLYEHVGERNIHFEWAEKKGADGLAEYIQERNLESLDGLPTDWKLQES